MRIPFDELVNITSRITPKGQASWFKKHFGLAAEHDCEGVIITREAFNALVAMKYGIPANDDTSAKRPTVKRIKKHA